MIKKELKNNRPELNEEVMEQVNGRLRQTNETLFKFVPSNPKGR